MIKVEKSASNSPTRKASLDPLGILGSKLTAGRVEAGKMSAAEYNSSKGG